MITVSFSDRWVARKRVQTVASLQHTRKCWNLIHKFTLPCTDWGFRLECSSFLKGKIWKLALSNV